jgi:hypothetical protein
VAIDADAGGGRGIVERRLRLGLHRSSRRGGVAILAFSCAAFGAFSGFAA